MMGTTSAPSSTDTLLKLLNDPDAVKKSIKDLKDAKKKADEAISKVAKAADLDRLHAEAKHTNERAKVEIAEAHAEASRIVRAANDKAADVMRQAGTTVDLLKTQKAQFELDCDNRSKDLDRREQAINEKEHLLRSEQTALSEERMDMAKDRAEIQRKKKVLEQL